MGYNVPVEAFGADPTGTRECTTEWNTAKQWCANNNVKGHNSGTYLQSGTVAPGGGFRWDYGKETVLQWVNPNTANLTEIQHVPQGATGPEGSGNFVLFDTSATSGAQITGKLVVSGGYVGNMSMAGRKTTAKNIVGMTAATSNSPNWTYQTIEIRRCGVGLAHFDFRGPGPGTLPTTRWTGSHLAIVACGRPILCGIDNNQLDEFSVDNMFIRYCANVEGLPALVRNTEFVGRNLFLEGLRDGVDNEPGTVTTTADSNVVVMSVDNADMQDGVWIQIKNADVNKAGDPIWLTAEIVSNNGLSLTLDRPAARAVTETYIANPPDFEVFRGMVKFKRNYPERNHGHALLVRDFGSVVGSVKISNGEFAGKENLGILGRTAPGTSCTIDVRLGAQHRLPNVCRRG